MSDAREPASPLSKRQKAVLCQLAGRAWNNLGTMLGFYDVTEFRHACVFDVTGRDGLTHCDQLDYIPLYNYWAKMLGLPLKEDHTPRNALERALWRLQDALQRWEFSEGYAAAIMRARLGPLAWEGMPLLHMAQKLGAEAVRQVSYTIINRGRERAAKIAANGGWPLPDEGARLSEPHTSPSTLPPGGLAEHFGAVLAKPLQAPRKRRARKEAHHG